MAHFYYYFFFIVIGFCSWSIFSQFLFSIFISLLKVPWKRNKKTNFFFLLNCDLIKFNVNLNEPPKRVYTCFYTLYSNSKKKKKIKHSLTPLILKYEHMFLFGHLPWEQSNRKQFYFLLLCRKPRAFLENCNRINFIYIDKSCGMWPEKIFNNEKELIIVYILIKKKY